MSKKIDLPVRDALDRFIRDALLALAAVGAGFILVTVSQNQARLDAICEAMPLCTQEQADE